MKIKVKNEKLKKILWKVISVFLITPSITYAAILDPIFDPNNPISNPNAIKRLILNMINFLLGIAGAVATLMIIISGIKYISSLGNEEKVEEAKRSLTASIMGLLIVILSYIILSIVVRALGGRVT